MLVPWRARATVGASVNVTWLSRELLTASVGAWSNEAFRRVRPPYTNPPPAPVANVVFRTINLPSEKKASSWVSLMMELSMVVVPPETEIR